MGRDYVFKADLQEQIRELERQEAALMREVKTIDSDAADPVEAAKRAARQEATVFVGGLENETEKAELLGLFEDCGHVDDVRFPGGTESGKASRGIAFVVFDTAMAARRAVGLSGEMFKGKKIRVAPANEGAHKGDDDGKGKGKDGKGKDKGKGKGKDKDTDDRRDDRRRSPSRGSRAILEGRRRNRSRSQWSRGREVPDRSQER